MSWMADVQDVLIKVLITAWLASIAVWDLRTGRMPNWLTVPVALLAGGARLYQGQWHILLVWALVFLIWLLHIMGGGDAKLLMGLFALFPTGEFFLLFGTMVIGFLIAILVRKYWGERPRTLLRTMVERVKTGQALPTEDELERKGERYAWVFCVPGIVYLWFFW